MRLRVGTESINFGVRRAVLAASGTLLLAGFVGANQAVAAGLPRSPNHLGASAASLKIKPRSIVFTGDGTGLLAGPNEGQERHQLDLMDRDLSRRYRLRTGERLRAVVCRRKIHRLPGENRAVAATIAWR